MFFFTKKQEERDNNQKLLKFSDDIAILFRELKDVKEQLEKLEIKALESRKIYKKKLQQAFGDEELESDPRTHNNPVLLPER